MKIINQNFFFPKVNNSLNY